VVRQGSIVWLSLLDPAGANPKFRPAVIVTPTDELKKDRTVVVAAATTTFTEPLPENKIKLPWHNNGHPTTGMRKPTVVVCDWIAEVNYNQIEEIIGNCPTSILFQILVKLPND
jgi:mRNA-degrading endonuclease toxin of MazEF toxin-antitoxin module